jgi:4-carboxymuconolactone decarboxylase
MYAPYSPESGHFNLSGLGRVGAYEITKAPRIIPPKRLSRAFLRGLCSDQQAGHKEDMPMHKSGEFEDPETKPLVERRDFISGAATVAGVSFLGLGQPADAAATESVQDRMPPIPADKMTEAQKKAAAELIAGPRGSLVGPFIPLLRSPEFMSRLQKTGEYLRYNTKLGSNISEFIILMTARNWTQQFEWDTHETLAKNAGVKAEIITAIAEGRRPAGMSADEEIVHDFCAELFHQQSVSDATYKRAVNRFGEQGVIDIAGLCGYYTMLGMIMNVARTPLPSGKTPPLASFPH